jgi:hypothetical protein
VITQEQLVCVSLIISPLYFSTVKSKYNLLTNEH